MALTPLATVADLQARGIDTTGPGVDAFLAAASAEVRDAAENPITRGTWTIAIPTRRSEWLPLSVRPVVSVDVVELDDETVTDYKLVGDRLWRRAGWQAYTPANAVVTFTAGLLEVPADIVDLVCSMVGYAIARSREDGYATRGDLISVRVDDYSEQYTTAQTQAGPMELPAGTRNRLRTRFGGGAYVLDSR